MIKGKNKTSLLKYEVCDLLMVWFGWKRFDYDSITVIKLTVRFTNHYNGLVSFDLVRFDGSVRFVVIFTHP